MRYLGDYERQRHARVKDGGTLAHDMVLSCVFVFIVPTAVGYTLRENNPRGTIPS